MKAQAPFLSIGASGSFAGVMTASSWKGRPYIRQLVTPANPKSAMQTAFRAMFKFLSQNWAALSDADKSSWEERAAQSNVSPFNAYMAYNQDLWGRALGPKVDPTETGATPPTLNAWSAAAGVRSVTLTLDIDSVEDGWGAIIYMEEGSAPEGTQDEVIQVVGQIINGVQTILVTKLTPGLVYHFKHKLFAIDGEFNALSSDINATPTS